MNEVSNWESVEDHPIYQQYADPIASAARKAAVEGASLPLEFVGMGATSIVLCDASGSAWKVARWGEQQFAAFEAEYEFLVTASNVDSLRLHVATPYGLHVNPLALERECVRAREHTSISGSRLWNLYERIVKTMRPYGWGRFEFKEDSFVLAPKRGPVLVDASSPLRIGWRLARYAEDVLAGRRLLREPVGDLIWAIEADAGNGDLPVGIAKRLAGRLASL